MFTRAAALIVDNSSLGPEFMALNRPVIWLSDPRWRRHVHHSGRFWEWVEGGLDVRNAEHLLRVDIVAHIVDDPKAEQREKVAASVYAHRDGQSAERAAGFVRALVQ